MTNRFIEIITNGLNPDRTIKRRQVIEAIDELPGITTFQTVRETLRNARWSYQNSMRYGKIMAWLQFPEFQDIKDRFENEKSTINEALAELKSRGMSVRTIPTKIWNQLYYKNEKGVILAYEQS